MAYSPENETVFNDLVDVCTRRQIVPYIGAGMSAFARYLPIFKDRFLFPTVDKLINTLCEECSIEKGTMSWIVAAEEIEKKCISKGEDFKKRLHDIYGGNLKNAEWVEILKQAENEAISFIPKLFSGPIVTTNYDQIIENTHNKELLVFLPNCLNGFERALYNGIGLVYKIHGCVSDPQNIILTKSAYGNVYKRNSELVQSLITFFQGFQFLFLGCSLNVVAEEDDDETKEQEDKTKERYIELWERLLNSGIQHFAILDCKKDEIKAKRKELEARNIRPILYEWEQYTSVKIIFKRLLERVKDISPNFLHDEISYIDDREVGKYDFNLGFGNIQLANYGKALEHIEKSIAILERRHTKAAAINLLKSYINRGIINKEHYEYEKAIEDFNKCIKLGEQILIETSKEKVIVEGELATAYINRGVVYECINKHNEALSDKNKSIEIWERMKDEGTLDDENKLATAYMNRGVSYNSMTKYKEAQDDFKKSIEIWKRMQDENKVIEERDYASTRILMNSNLLQNSSLDYSKSDLVKAIISKNKNI